MSAFFSGENTSDTMDFETVGGKSDNRTKRINSGLENDLAEKLRCRQLLGKGYRAVRVTGFEPGEAVHVVPALQEGCDDEGDVDLSAVISGARQHADRLLHRV